MITRADFDELMERPAITTDGIDDIFSPEGFEAMKQRWLAFWSEEAVSYEDLNAWCSAEATEDCANYRLPVMPVAPAVATAYEMGFLFGWLLHKKAQARRAR